MSNRKWLENHLSHAMYAKDQALAAADFARVQYKYSREIEDYREWKENVRNAWRMREIVRNTLRELAGHV